MTCKFSSIKVLTCQLCKKFSSYAVIYECSDEDHEFGLCSDSRNCTPPGEIGDGNYDREQKQVHYDDESCEWFEKEELKG